MVKYQVSFVINMTTLLFVFFTCQAFRATFHYLFFYGTVISEMLCIARLSSSVISFYEKTNARITRMKKQGGNREKVVRQIMKTFENHQLVFQKYDISNGDILRTFQ